MADERDEKFEGQDEGEYHFSDEQMNYEMEDVPQHEEPKAAAPKEALAEKLGKNRRYLIGAGVFLGLIFIIYKMLIPPAAAPSSDITQVAPARAMPSGMRPQNNPQAMVAARPAQQAAPAATAQMMPPAQPASQSPQSVPSQMQQQQPQTQQQQQQLQQQQPSQPVMQQMSQPQMPTTAMMPVPMASLSDVKAIIDKLDSLAQQNEKITYTIGTEYPQRFSSYEEQNAALQAKVQELTNRLSTLEASLNQLTQVLQVGSSKPQQPPVPPAMVQVSPGAKPMEPKMAYTVQAIIPGRAWLKSDAGDTVTIAEGDVLKDFGRVTKIDPYDGVVDIDTGAKVISLTYGGGSE